MPPLAEDVLAFWFDNALQNADAARARAKIWFSYDPLFDAGIASAFGDLPERAREGEFDLWAQAPRPALARIIVLDQFPRNLFRDDAKAFAYDSSALACSIAALEARLDQRLHPLEAVFMYLPFEHAEDALLQERSVGLFEALQERSPPGCEALFEGFADYARRHRDVVARFGRFPYRNAVLGRTSTPAEQEYLDGGGERFGPSARSKPPT